MGGDLGSILGEKKKEKEKEKKSKGQGRFGHHIWKQAKQEGKAGRQTDKRRKHTWTKAIIDRNQFFFLECKGEIRLHSL